MMPWREKDNPEKEHVTVRSSLFLQIPSTSSPAKPRSW
jgi:hypothetical protein